MTNYNKFTRFKLEVLAIERFGSLQSASLMAERECRLNESILRNKAPWIRALEKPLSPEDLGAIAAHETWAKGIREDFRKGDRNDP